MHPAGRPICQLSPQRISDLLETYRRSGQADDFEQIVRRFAALVLCECRRVTGNIYDAEDASQMVFLALAMEIKSGVQIRQPTAWLKRVSVCRQALKIVRSRSRRRRREDAVRRSELHIVDTDASLDSAVIAGMIRDAIDLLPERYRLAVILHYFGGMTLELIAAELKITKQAVGTRLHRGRKMLGERLSQQGVMLDERTLNAALGVMVPAAVVGALIRHGASVCVPRVAPALPAAMGQMLHAVAAASLGKPLRLAAVAAALAGASGGFALAMEAKFPSLRPISPAAIVHWLGDFVQRHTPSMNFSASSLGDLSASARQVAPKISAPIFPPLISGTEDFVTEAALSIPPRPDSSADRCDPQAR